LQHDNEKQYIEVVVSRNNFLSTNNINLAKEQNFMKKLNKKKIKWIVRDVERGIWILYSIEKLQDINPR